ncbi:unnamed protein product [Vitrella brassicaformis CCMP3155]|uniref:UNC93-like protein MFSD11 n=3 Tax=Vitrella brassicaformis TaxID=1169539 RepID=A0A0G4EJD7_VITBC|nr:unnamed protein product [Vitrella brassicaformis CCMP3155]|mmetsp:Transcript_758/g.2030  ORF Transcript_758/g.2030 Transcript_758/m.2030 type:complete len:624 (+) Transcript_758:113-1984(+)|eukprot:CEL96627.1 unnamed protein product [Vitrella brassicaformis CCMP3155]
MAGHLRDVIFLGLGFFGLFAAFNTSQALLTVFDGGTGLLGFALLYSVFALTSFVAPPVIAKWFPPRHTHRWALVTGSLPYVIFVGSAAITALPPALTVIFTTLVGFGAPLIWTVQGDCLGRYAVWDATNMATAADGGGGGVSRSTEDGAEEENEVAFSMSQADLSEVPTRKAEVQPTPPAVPAASDALNGMNGSSLSVSTSPRPSSPIRAIRALSPSSLHRLLVNWFRQHREPPGGLQAPLLPSPTSSEKSHVGVQCVREVTPAQLTSEYNGIFFGCFQLSGGVGLLLSSVILYATKNHPLDAARAALFTTLAACAAVGMVLLTLPRSVPVQVAGGKGIHDAEKTVPSALETLWLACSDPHVYYLIPLLLANGGILAFVNGDFSAAVVTPLLSPAATALIIGVFFGVNALMSLLWGLIIHGRYMRRWSVFVTAAVCQGLVLIYLLIQRAVEPPNFTMDTKADRWMEVRTPRVWDWVVMLVSAVLLGAGDSVFESQLSAVFQTFFHVHDASPTPPSSPTIAPAAGPTSSAASPSHPDPGIMDPSERLLAAMAQIGLWRSVGQAVQFFLSAAMARWLGAKRVPWLAGLLLVELVVAMVCLWLLHTRVGASIDVEAGGRGDRKRRR